MLKRIATGLLATMLVSTVFVGLATQAAAGTQQARWGDCWDRKIVGASVPGVEGKQHVEWCGDGIWRVTSAEAECLINYSDSGIVTGECTYAYAEGGNGSSTFIYETGWRFCTFTHCEDHFIKIRYYPWGDYMIMAQG